MGNTPTGVVSARSAGVGLDAARAAAFNQASTNDSEEHMNRGIIGAIIGVLVIIILVLVVLRLT